MEKIRRSAAKILFAIIIVAVLVGCGAKEEENSSYKKTIITTQNDTAKDSIPEEPEPEPNEMPDLFGMNWESAELVLKEAGILYTVAYEHSTEYFYKDILAVSAQTGDLIPVNDRIVVTVCDGHFVELPDISGKKEADAQKIIEELGLHISIKRELNNEVKKGRVISTTQKIYCTDNPALNSTIELIVCDGKYVVIPSFKGEKEEEAKKKLKELGVKYTVKYTYDDITASATQKYFTGYISNQDISGKVAEGTKVVLTVNRPAVFITYAGFELNSVGGLNVYYTIKNVSDAQIAYVTFDTYVYDRMGNKAYCTIRDTNHMKLTYTGPLNAGKKSKSTYWSAVIYNYTIAVIQPKVITVEFTNGNKQVINSTIYWHSKSFYGGDLHD